MNNKKELIIGLIIKSIAVIASLYGLILTVTGFKTFTYFTTLSNVAVDLILIVFIVADILFLKSKGAINIKSNRLYIIKYLMTASITLTFLVYMFILAPTDKAGIVTAYMRNHASSLCLHFINPVFAIIDFLLFDYRYESKKSHVFLATVPPLVYLTFVTILGYSGMRWDGMSAPYNFLNFDAPTGWFGFDLSILSSKTLGIGVFYMVILLIILFIGMGAAYLALKNLRRKMINR